MQIKALRSTHGAYGTVRRGQVVDVPDRTAQQLVKRGIFVPVQDSGEAAGKAAARPPSRHGGRTGKGKRSSSSPEVQASETSPSTAPKGGQGS